MRVLFAGEVSVHYGFVDLVGDDLAPGASVAARRTGRMSSISDRARRRTAAALLGAVFLAGCSSSPYAVSDEKLAAVRTDLTRVQSDLDALVLGAQRTARPSCRSVCAKAAPTR